MKKWTACLLLTSLGFSITFPQKAFPASNVKAINIPDDTDRRKKINELVAAIEEIRKMQGDDDIRDASLAKLYAQLEPLVREHMAYLEGARDTRIAALSNDAARQAVRESFDERISELREILNNNALSGGSTVAALRPRTAGSAPAAMSLATPTASPSPSPTASATPSPAASATPSPSPSPTASPTPSSTASPTPSPYVAVDVPDTDSEFVSGKVSIPAGTVLTNMKVEVLINDGTASTSAGTFDVLSNDFPFSHRTRRLLRGDIVSVVLKKNTTTIDSQSVVVQDKVDPTESGLFGLLFSGVVVTREAQSFNEAHPFLGFQAGWGSRVYGIKGNITDADFRRSFGCSPLPMPLKADYDKIVDSTGKVYAAVRPGKTYKNGSCEITFIDGPFTSSKTHRYSIRFQGLFSSEGRAAIATPSGTPPAGVLNRPFPFIEQRQTFSPEFTIWREQQPLADFSYGPYITIGATTVQDRNDKFDQQVTDRETNRQVLANVISPGGTKIYGEIGMMSHLRFSPARFFLQNFAGFGYYEGLRGTKYKFGDTTVAANRILNGNTRFRFVDKLRIFPEGLQVDFGRQVSVTPMFGVDLNAGSGPDIVRFFTGFAVRLRRFDLKPVNK